MPSIHAQIVAAETIARKFIELADTPKSAAAARTCQIMCGALGISFADWYAALERVQPGFPAEFDAKVAKLNLPPVFTDIPLNPRFPAHGWADEQAPEKA